VSGAHWLPARVLAEALSRGAIDRHRHRLASVTGPRSPLPGLRPLGPCWPTWRTLPGRLRANRASLCARSRSTGFPTFSRGHSRARPRPPRVSLLLGRPVLAVGSCRRPGSSSLRSHSPSRCPSNKRPGVAPVEWVVLPPSGFRSRVFSTPQRFRARSSFAALFHAATVSGFLLLQRFPLAEIAPASSASHAPLQLVPAPSRRGRVGLVTDGFSRRLPAFWVLPLSPVDYGSPFRASLLRARRLELARRFPVALGPPSLSRRSVRLPLLRSLPPSASPFTRARVASDSRSILSWASAPLEPSPPTPWTLADPPGCPLRARVAPKDDSHAIGWSDMGRRSDSLLGLLHLRSEPSRRPTTSKDLHGRTRLNPWRQVRTSRKR